VGISLDTVLPGPGMSGNQTSVRPDRRPRLDTPGRRY